MEPSGVEGALQPTSRRSFIKFVLGFSAVSMVAIVAPPIVGFLMPRRSRDSGTGGRVLAGTTDDIPVGSGNVIAMGSQPVIVVDLESGVKAYSAVCTHLGCIVAYDRTLGHIVCPCHDGHFSPTDGGVLSGPPPRPLPPIAVAVEGKKIYLGG
jgi:cytochrome b6-f complex iron-sulfur subunit